MLHVQDNAGRCCFDRALDPLVSCCHVMVGDGEQVSVLVSAGNMEVPSKVMVSFLTRLIVMIRTFG